MKRKNLFLAFIISLFLVSFSFAQTESFVDRAPKKNQNPETSNSLDDYCDASGGGDEYIDGVELGEICNLSTGYNTGYEDFSNFKAYVIPGMTYTLVLYTGDMNSSDDYGIWIDWNQDEIFEPITEEIVCEHNYGMEIHNFDITVPVDAILGNTIMHIRLKYNGNDCGEPCGTTPYGEVEDYGLVVIEDSFGNLEGNLIDCDNGNPIEGGLIQLGPYTTITASDGYFIIEEIPIGEWELNYSAPGYCQPQEQVMVTIIEGQTTTLDDLCLYPLGFEVDPISIDVELDPNNQTQEIVTLENTGYCDIEWSASVQFISQNGSDELFDLIWEMPVGVGGGEAGIETNGNYIYTTKWNGTGEYYRYAMDGTYIEEIMVVGAEGTRDMAFDGTYFYGGAASPTVFELDLDNATLVSTFTAPTDCRAIAYNEYEDVFYANNWGSMIFKFDKSGTNLGSFPCGPVGDSYYGFAYDGYLEGSPYLWGYAQVGASQNELVQIELPSGNETGLTFDIGSVLDSTDIAGGLAIDDHIQPGFWAFLGTCQNVNIWTAELNEAIPPWLTIEPTSGILTSSDIDELNLSIDATDMIPGNYQANIHFATDPYIEVPNVNVSLQVLGFVPPFNLTGYYDCTHVYLSWEMPAGNNPTSFNIYRDGDFIGSVIDLEFYEAYVIPQAEYCYQVTAVYEVGESIPSPEFCITVPTPDDLEPYDLEAIMDIPNENDVTLVWEEPLCCVSPDGYDIYRDNIKVNDNLVTELTFVETLEPSGLYEYYVTAVYYFGESETSNWVYVLFYGTDELGIENCKIFPNPCSDFINIQSDLKISNISIYNVQGHFMKNVVIKENDTQIDVSQFEPGVYFMKLVIEDITVIRKIVVE